MGFHQHLSYFAILLVIQSKDKASRIDQVKGNSMKELHSWTKNIFMWPKQFVFYQFEESLVLFFFSIQGVTNRIHRARVSCYYRATNWDVRSDKPIMFLDRQNVDCPRPYFLAKFRLGREGNYNSARVRYSYRCCKFVL